MTTELSFRTLSDQLSRRAARAFVSKLSPTSIPLRTTLVKAFEHGPGADGSFLAPPVFEPMFGFETVPGELKSFAPGLLTTALVEALDKAEEGQKERPNRFPKERHPYTHQLNAWQRLAEPDPRSVLVTSGTGSGKTECFLVPILDSLVRHLSGRTQLSGVQAILLYPLNALINNQRERLSAWTRGHQGQIRYCLYNGQTPRSTQEHKYRDAPEQVHGRDRLRENPPPILLTNTTMLEYMLIRRDDRPILTKSQGMLRWIVVDEAHTYLGSQAAELSLLLRRVMIAFGVRPEDVRFVATSATIGGAAGIAGAGSSEVVIVVAPRSCVGAIVSRAPTSATVPTATVPATTHVWVDNAAHHTGFTIAGADAIRTASAAATRRRVPSAGAFARRDNASASRDSSCARDPEARTSSARTFVKWRSNASRAARSRDHTVSARIPSAAAISLPLSCSSSASTKTSRLSSSSAATKVSTIAIASRCVASSSSVGFSVSTMAIAEVRRPRRASPRR